MFFNSYFIKEEVQNNVSDLSKFILLKSDEISARKIDINKERTKLKQELNRQK